SLLVLLLFAVSVCMAVTPAEMKELLANGAPQRLRSFNWLYLTDDRPAIKERTLWAMPKQDWLQDWTIVQINDHEVSIKSNSRGYNIGHGTDDNAVPAIEVNWGIFTPVKNPNATIMDELLANGGKRTFKSFNELYLTEDRPDTDLYALEKRVWMPPQKWTIEQMNNNEVAIKSHRNLYVRHGSGDWAREAADPDQWVMLTPVKNAGGTWSFKSRDDKWLSGHKEWTPIESRHEKKRYAVSFENNNNKCEKWKLE
ncbi:hypothetical protein PRIPAC_91673, partial [Pristionchus pacificus]